MSKTLSDDAKKILAQLKDPEFLKQHAAAAGLRVDTPEKPKFKPEAFKLELDIADDAELTGKALKEILGKALASVASHVDKQTEGLYTFLEKSRSEEEGQRKFSEEKKKILEFRESHPDFEEHLEEIQKQYRANGGDIAGAYKAAKKLNGKWTKEDEAKESGKVTPKKGAKVDEEEDDDPPPTSLPSDEGGDKHDDGNKKRSKGKTIHDKISAQADELFKKLPDDENFED